ncbi:MAG: hypothetical protein PHI39_05130 [Kiritimatiellae bacterium]|nr:hypothetical protein [Kiritimatiellia bacterium]
MNRLKSAVAPVEERTFPGCRRWPGGTLGIVPQSAARLKPKVRQRPVV